MRICQTSVVLASIFSPVFSFSYLESLGGANTNPVAYSPPATVSPSNGASYLDALSGSVAVASVVAEPPVAAAPQASAADSPALTGNAPAAVTGVDYMDSLSTGASAATGPGIQSYKDCLPVNKSVGGAGIPTYTGNLPSVNIVAGGTGMLSHTDNLSGGAVGVRNFSPFGSTTTKPSALSFSGTTSGSPVDFTLETSNLSGLVKGFSGGNTITLSGSIDSVSFH